MRSLPEVLGWGRHSEQYSRYRVAPQNTKAEMLGLAEGLLADGMIVVEEAQFLYDWIDRHHDVRDEWPACALFPRLESMLADGALSTEEQCELLGTLRGYVDIRTAAERSEQSLEPRAPAIDPALSVESPFDEPAPPITHLGRRFVVTGDFACASRPKVVGTIEALGGSVSSSVSKKVQFLIVGSVGSELWKGGSWGTKIESAVRLKRAGCALAVVRENDWYLHVPPDQMIR